MPPSSLWQRLISQDLLLIHAVQRFMYDPAHARLKRNVDRFVSSNPLEDISIVTWCSFFVVMFLNINTTRWFSFLWSTSLNLFVATSLRATLRFRRPFEVDPTLRPLANRNRDNHAFPSLESHMAVVVYGFIAARFAEWYATIPLFALTLFVGFTRVYACSRFVHQVLLSYLTGILGLLLSFAAMNVLKDVDVHWRHHWYYFVFVFVVLGASASLSISDGNSRFGGIPREEYVRVVGGILNTDPSKIADHMATQTASRLDSMEGLTEKQRKREAAKMQNRRDSFFFLQNSLIKKDSDKKDIKRTFYEKVMRERQGEEYRNLTQAQKWEQQLRVTEDDFTRAFLVNNGAHDLR